MVVVRGAGSSSLPLSKVTRFSNLSHTAAAQQQPLGKEVQMNSMCIRTADKRMKTGEVDSTAAAENKQRIKIASIINERATEETETETEPETTTNRVCHPLPIQYVVQ